MSHASRWIRALAVVAGPLVGLSLIGAAGPARAERFGRGPGTVPVTVGSSDSGLASSSAPARTGSATVTGSGYGHGVGMSQYGAYGMARAGSNAAQIVSHYFTGVSVAPAADGMDIRVNVVHRGTGVTLAPVAVSGATGHRLRLSPQGGTALLLSVGDRAVVSPSGSSLSVRVVRASAGPVTVTTAALDVDWTGTATLAGPPTRVALSASIAGSSAAKARSYRWGLLRLTPVGGAVEAVTVVDVHSGYLRGIAEMPSSWPAAALQAQVIAARSYALVGASSSPRADCGGCQVWDDQRSQVYLGWGKEGERIGSVDYGARWVAAVTATSASATTGIAVLYQGRPVPAYYSSSTGGATRDPRLVWGGSVPYLRSVPDPWSLDPGLNPRFAQWSRAVSVSSLLSAFSITDGSGLASVTVTARDAAGAALTVTAVSGSGAVRTLTGEQFRARLGLPGSWVSGLTLPSA